MKRLWLAFGSLALMAASPGESVAQGRYSPDIAAQEAAMAKLTFLEGRWSGQGWSLTPNGEKAPFRQTEEIAFELGGRILIIRGKGYFDLDDAPDFEAFAVVSFDDRDNSYAFRSYAQGYAGTFAADVPAADTLVWKAGPGVRYTLTASDGRWHEIGERRGGDGNWVKFLEMDLTRAD